MTNLPASIAARLNRYRLRHDLPYQEVLQYFAMERFLYRLSQTPHAEQFVLEGGLMFRVWSGPAARPTKDIDLLARMDSSVDRVVEVVREICLVEVEPDGLTIDLNSVRGRIIKESAFCAGTSTSTATSFPQRSATPSFGVRP